MVVLSDTLSFQYHSPTNPASAVSLLKCIIANRLLYIEPYLLQLAAAAAVVVVVVVVVVDGGRSLLMVVPMLGTRKIRAVRVVAGVRDRVSVYL